MTTLELSSTCLCPQMPLSTKATSKKLDGTSGCLPYRGEAETQGDKVFPTPAKKPLFTSPISCKSIPLLTPEGETHSFSVQRETEYHKENKPKQNQTPKRQLILSQAIHHLKHLFGGAELSEMAPGTNYHLSSCTFWQFQEWSGVPRYIFLVRSKDCLPSSFSRSCLK